MQQRQGLPARRRGHGSSIPAHGEATFLLNCPKRHGSVGGSDSEATSKHVHVWFDGQISAPINQGTTHGAVPPLSRADRQRQAGRIRAAARLHRAAVPEQHPLDRFGARRRMRCPGTSYGVPLQPRRERSSLIAGAKQRTTMSRCPGEKLIGQLERACIRHVGAELDRGVCSRLHRASRTSVTVTTKTALAGHKVSGDDQDGTSRCRSDPLAEVQIGAVCAP